MLNILFWVLVGALIGWHVEKPFWANVIYDKVQEAWHKLTGGKNDEPEEEKKEGE